jgi:hypothetical protein
VTRQHRLSVYSSHVSEQSLIERTSVSGTLPTTAGPFVAAVVDNAGANKLDYYLHRQLEYDVGRCVDGVRTSTVRLRLRSAAPAGLPAYVTGSRDGGMPPATSRLLVYLFLSRGATVQSVSLDGRPTPVVRGAERGRPVVELTVDLRAGQPRQLAVTLTEPATPGGPSVWVQPIVVPQATHVIDHPCREL